jgi:choline dehydrogenase-like flavoprotein
LAVASAEREGGNHCVALRPLLAGKYAEVREAMKAVIANRLSVRSTWSLVRRFGAGRVLAAVTNLAWEKFGLGSVVRRVLVFCYLEQPTRSTSGVTLTERTDAHGRVVPVVSWEIGDHERAAVAEMSSVVERTVARMDGVSFQPAQDAADRLASGAHLAGTMRIGRSSHEGAIDADLRVFGQRNTYVCDLSLFPNYGNANPSFTLAAFALRLAKHLGRELGSP